MSNNNIWVIRSFVFVLKKSGFIENTSNMSHDLGQPAPNFASKFINNKKMGDLRMVSFLALLSTYLFICKPQLFWGIVIIGVCILIPASVWWTIIWSLVKTIILLFAILMIIAFILSIWESKKEKKEETKVSG